MITLYGITASRAFRCLWMLEEMGLPYRREKLDYRGEDLRSPAYLAINPNARIPALKDGDYILWESMAINLYLARRYGGEKGLWPDSLESEGLAMQWSFWVMSEIETHLLSLLMHKRMLPADKRDPGKASRSEGILRAPLQVLEQSLAGRDYLVDGRFTVADLNVASVLSWTGPARYSLKSLPHIHAWMNRCLDRPARKRAQSD